MTKLSEGAKLSQIYTNHSIRATGATILTKSMFNPSQIMAVTGHKSVQSLTVYQRTDTEDKKKFNSTITTKTLYQCDTQQLSQ
jgi:integrase